MFLPKQIQDYVKKLRGPLNQLSSFSISGLNEILLDNYIDADLQEFLCPLNLGHYVLFSPKYSIRYNFITSNSCTANCFSLFYTFSFMMLYTSHEVLDPKLKYLNSIMLSATIFNFLVYCIGCGQNSILNIIQSNTHVNLILTVQKIHKSFKHTNICKSFVIGNWIFVITLLTFYIGLAAIETFVRKLGSNCISYVPVLITDFNIIYKIRMVKLLRYYTVSWTSELKRINQLEINSTHDIYTISYIAHFCGWQLKQPRRLLGRNEYYDIMIYDDEYKIKRNKSPEKRIAYKRLRRACNLACKIMKTGSFVEADATLPLSLLSLLANYVVVLLQFALL
ncbi:unnamed protein product [Parnassius mnemosyne]|uniref:Gustatory receptor n=1 Tax=Parnassius mnemosyne TaxID=213953 RepID=A0AAV1LB93_9NEOP